MCEGLDLRKLNLVLSVNTLLNHWPEERHLSHYFGHISPWSRTALQCSSASASGQYIKPAVLSSGRRFFSIVLKQCFLNAHRFQHCFWQHHADVCFLNKLMHNQSLLARPTGSTCRFRDLTWFIPALIVQLAGRGYVVKWKRNLASVCTWDKVALPFRGGHWRKNSKTWL